MLISSQSLHIIQMFSLYLFFRQVSYARCVQTSNVCRTISIFVIDAGCWYDTAIIGKINSHGTYHRWMERKKTSISKTKSHTQIYPIKSTICSVLREFNFRYFFPHCLVMVFYRFTRYLSFFPKLNVVKFVWTECENPVYIVYTFYFGLWMVVKLEKRMYETTLDNRNIQLKNK